MEKQNKSAMLPLVHFKRQYKPGGNKLAHGEVVRFCTDHQGVIYALQFGKQRKCFTISKYGRRILTTRM